MTPANPVLVHALRGDTVESFHRGALAIVDADGAVHTALGDIDRPIFPRSAVKALQALPLVASGAADHWGLGDDALALACASHGGEPAHTAVAADMLRRAGLNDDTLECGTHWPSAEPAAHALARAGRAPGPLHNNCSGKHAGFACLGCLLARHAGRDPADFLRGYVAPTHPVMREVTAALTTATGRDMDKAPVGTDGCSIPTFGVPLRALARAFACFGAGHGLPPEHQRAAARLRRAVASHPFMVGGSGRFDTVVMQHFGERVFCKVGAEGVYTAALPERGLGVAIKMDDGNTARAVEVVMARVIEALVARTPTDAAALAGWVTVERTNWNGIATGPLQPAPALVLSP